ncbi:flagellar basal body rod protein FlgB [Paenibacillus beijingensis]|uniref:Flagellar basal body rod protein FlgB n=1 Tax=Paenibacillus beijingensis TaxID=1126833 RepID=A0A0D5NNG7_9BACL|nr:flagellar basal body rod protein FlgB [Paenibacillus beijingensis]AJY76562.1 flagellar basal-body rod protein FlgB [Paenibacillus beijingensis]
MNLLNGAAFSRLHGALKAAETRQQVISDNIANADTPNFKRSDIMFEDLLSASIGGGETKPLSGFRTNSRHFVIGPTNQIPGMQFVTDADSIMNNNGSNVDIDREMTLLAKNQLRYNLYTEQVNHDIKMMKTAIDGSA